VESTEAIRRIYDHTEITSVDIDRIQLSPLIPVELSEARVRLRSKRYGTECLKVYIIKIPFVLNLIQSSPQMALACYSMASVLDLTLRF